MQSLKTYISEGLFGGSKHVQPNFHNNLVPDIKVENTLKNCKDNDIAEAYKSLLGLINSSDDFKKFISKKLKNTYIDLGISVMRDDFEQDVWDIGGYAPDEDVRIAVYIDNGELNVDKIDVGWNGDEGDPMSEDFDYDYDLDWDALFWTLACEKKVQKLLKKL